MAKFEIVSKYNDADLRLPVRKTAQSAGYDFFVAEDTIILPYNHLMDRVVQTYLEGKESSEVSPLSLDEVASYIKAANAKPTLVPTGIKAHLDPGTYLELSVRSSCPLKYWLLEANSVGIIDADYYNNPDNEGHIFFQIINLSPLPILLKKGDCIGQGIIKHYGVTEDDNATGLREGGFGSTDAASQPVLASAT